MTRRGKRINTPLGLGLVIGKFRDNIIMHVDSRPTTLKGVSEVYMFPKKEIEELNNDNEEAITLLQGLWADSHRRCPIL